VAYTPTVNEEFVTILPADQLRVFTKAHPMPGDALMGDEAVIQYLDLK
jgi:hypothetical protein